MTLKSIEVISSACNHVVVIRSKFNTNITTQYCIQCCTYKIINYKYVFNNIRKILIDFRNTQLKYPVKYFMKLLFTLLNKLSRIHLLDIITLHNSTCVEFKLNYRFFKYKRLKRCIQKDWIRTNGYSFIL